MEFSAKVSFGKVQYHEFNTSLKYSLFLRAFDYLQNLFHISFNYISTSNSKLNTA